MNHCRQIDIIEDGGTIDQETRLFDPKSGETRSMRSKEEAFDYRYFPDPDLLPVVIEDEEIEAIRDATDDPELKEQLATSADQGDVAVNSALPDRVPLTVRDTDPDDGKTNVSISTSVKPRLPE